MLAVLRKYCPPEAGRRILVVEDESATRGLIRRVLEKEEWTVIEAENGLIGLDRLAEGPADLIVLDLMMPEMDGFEFISRLRKENRWRAIPVVVLTAKTLTSEDRRRLEGSVERLLHKGDHALESLVSVLDGMFQKGSVDVASEGSS